LPRNCASTEFDVRIVLIGREFWTGIEVSRRACKKEHTGTKVKYGIGINLINRLKNPHVVTTGEAGLTGRQPL